jgi:hypothetical protein
VITYPTSPKPAKFSGDRGQLSRRVTLRPWCLYGALENSLLPPPEVSLQSGTPPSNSPPIDEARLLPHLRERSRLEERARLERHQSSVLRTEYVRAEAEGTPVISPAFAKKLPGDPRALRGIPIVARSVGGVSPGTQPEQETIRRSERAA